MPKASSHEKCINVTKRENEGRKRAIATSHETCKNGKKEGRKRAKLIDHETYKNGKKIAG